MNVLETIAVAFSMYSAVPMPQFAWTEKNMKYALCAFPLIGAVIGGAEWAAVYVCDLLGAPDILRGMLLCVLPVLLTGGIHLDGYCDTCDALASHGEREKKLEIMKDPHIGSFAAIRLCVYMLADFALWVSLPEYPAVPLLLCFCLSRCLSGIAVCAFPKAKDTGLARLFSDAADQKRTVAVLLLFAVLCAAGLCFAGQAAGVAALAMALAVFAWHYLTSKREFGGITGDLAGWFVQKCELWMLAAICVVLMLEK